LARRPEQAEQEYPKAQVISWEATSGPPSADLLEGLDAVVNLVGEPIAAGRWTKARKKAIRESRTMGTAHLVEALSRCQSRPRVLINSSAVGFYGDRGDEILEENSVPGAGFLASVCREWESQAEQASQLGIRVVLLRGGLVLSTRGGALPRILLPFKAFVGGPVGSGKQWMSWVHIDDEVDVIRYLIDQDSIRGPVHCTAPNPVTNREFSRNLGEVLRRPSFMPVPAFALRILFGEMADTLLEGQRVVPRKLEAAGYRFRFPELRGALKDLI
jgi:uncharacterized protein (TIGR01777 family)